MSLDGASVIHASRHYERAGLRPQAFRASMTARQEASRISARHEAFELYQRAIENMPADLPVAEQAELYERFSGRRGRDRTQRASAAAAAEARRELYLAAGRPLKAASQLISRPDGRGPRWGAARRGLGPFMEQGPRRDRRASRRTTEREVFRGYAARACMANDELWASDLAEAPRLAICEARELAESVGDREMRPRSRPDPGPDRYRRRPLRVAASATACERPVRHARPASNRSGSPATATSGSSPARSWIGKPPRSRSARGSSTRTRSSSPTAARIMATTAALLDWAAGQWDAATSAPATSWSIAAAPAARSARSTSSGSWRWAAASRTRPRRWLERVAHDRAPDRRGAVHPDAALGPGRDRPADRRRRSVRSPAATRPWTIAIETGERALAHPVRRDRARAVHRGPPPNEAERWVARTREHLDGWERVAGAALDHADGLVRLAAGRSRRRARRSRRRVDGWDGARPDLGGVAGPGSTSPMPAPDEPATPMRSRSRDRRAARGQSLGSGPLQARAVELGTREPRAGPPSTSRGGR